LVAGGANFPDKKPWEGGKKIWHDQIYALEEPKREWKHVGSLPKPRAYGVSISWLDGIICIGGSDSSAHTSDVFRMSYKNSNLAIESMPNLPVPLANACGAIVQDVLIVSGGLEHPDATDCHKRTWALDLRALKDNAATLQWIELAELPASPRMLSTSASDGSAFWLIGGVTLSADPQGKPQREYLKECWKLEFDRNTMSGRWRAQEDLPVALAASPSPAIAQAGQLWILGGDDGTQVSSRPNEHRGFSKTIYQFDIDQNRWTPYSKSLSISHVTVPCVAWSDGWVIPSGEIRPGIRSQEVWFLRNQPDP
jgi:N-acetylneuraminic acid mutarotase